MESLFRSTTPTPSSFLIAANDEHGLNPPTAGKRTPYIRYLGRSIYENEFNKEAKKFFINACLRVGFRVFDVSPMEPDLPVSQRVSAVQSANPTLVVTFAYNAFLETWNTARGIEVFYSARNAQAASSRRLSEYVYYQLIVGTGQNGRGVKTLNVGILSSVSMPSTLVEAGFMTNWNDAKLMLDPDYQRIVGEYTCAGVCNYLGVPFTPQLTPQTRPLVRRGSRGADVTYLQQKLLAKFYPSGPLDGIFGEQTERAVRAFQRENNLVEDGIVGRQTWGALIPLGGTSRQP